MRIKEIRWLTGSVCSPEAKLRFINDSPSSHRFILFAPPPSSRSCNFSGTARSAGFAGSWYPVFATQSRPGSTDITIFLDGQEEILVFACSSLLSTSESHTASRIVSLIEARGYGKQVFGSPVPRRLLSLEFSIISDPS